MSELREKLRSGLAGFRDLFADMSVDNIRTLLDELDRVEKERDEWQQRAADRDFEAEQRAKKQWAAEGLIEQAVRALQRASEIEDEMVVAAMEHVPGCDHDDMVSAVEAALAASPYLRLARSTLSLLKASRRPCTCHPDDNPPTPCPQKYALNECRKAAENERIS